jgi:hypothetical protein
MKKKNCQIIDCSKAVSHTREGHLVLHPANIEELASTIEKDLNKDMNTTL